LLTDPDDRHEGVRFLIHDRGAKFAHTFDELLASAGIRVVHTPYQTPTANAVVERFIGSARRECLDRLLIVGQRRLLHVLIVYVTHYNRRRGRSLSADRDPWFRLSRRRGDGLGMGPTTLVQIQ
jgi:transposase InsO family protein